MKFYGIMLNDNTDMAYKVHELIENTTVPVRYEVMEEVVHVLIKVYLLPRNEITDGIKIFLSCPNVKSESKEVLIVAFKTFTDVNMDFVDCVLYRFKVIYDHDVFTVDKQLNFVIHKL